MKEQLSGIIEHIIYHNEENGYTVFEVAADHEEMTCIGYFGDIREGFCIEGEGEYTEHAAYGRQFRFTSYHFKEPESIDAIETYIGSGAIKGIGKALAARIVKYFGDETLRIIEEEPERLAEVKGISAKKAREIGTQAAEQAGMRKAMVFLSGFGISLKLGIRIFQKYGDQIYDILRTNPYRLAEEVDGIGFMTADKIAAEAGIAADSEYRIRSGILYVLMNAAGEGHVYLPEELLLQRTADLLGPISDPDAIGHVLSDLSFEKRVVIREADGTRIVYWGNYYYLELTTARMLLDLSEPTGVSRDEAEESIRELEKGSKVRLDEVQREALHLAAMNGLLILTGGPGTGKTTTINELIRYFRREDKTVLLAAPTGRAAKRMTETTGYEASTIHRLLEISSLSEDSPERVHFERNETNPLEADVVIIDEMSMVDIFLMHALLSAVAVGTRLILVGDVDQLPSVGAGAVLRDLISSDAFPCIRLTRIFRQADASDIVVNAHRINRGEQIRLNNQSKDFFFLKRSDINLLISGIIELISKKLPPYVHAKPYDIQVLCPMRKGALGAERLNTILQEYLNPPSFGKKEKQHGDRLFRVGDKVMQTKNNYQMEWEILGRHGIPVEEGTGIFNGDMGIVRDLNEGAQLLEIEFDENRIVEYPFASLEDLELAYAVTIHKSQGSEYPAVILPLLGGPRMLMTRNLLYTAVTRAKSCAVILGSDETVGRMIENESQQRRYTSLDRRIRELSEQNPLM
ncbi:MAG: ATP-dependent RecD-like DNA helicase [Lachnospiraceae bacterium]|nr:ATP-dependent RecD-like DNA helicase [Lachnospiraceae bacterium]